METVFCLWFIFPKGNVKRLILNNYSKSSNSLLTSILDASNKSQNNQFWQRPNLHVIVFVHNNSARHDLHDQSVTLLLSGAFRRNTSNAINFTNPTCKGNLQMYWIRHPSTRKLCRWNWNWADISVKLGQPIRKLFPILVENIIRKWRSVFRWRLTTVTIQNGQHKRRSVCNEAQFTQRPISSLTE